MTDERLKIWIDFGKWAVVSVGLVVMTKIIDSGFKDREVGMNELKEYDKYVSLVTDNTKISERRLLAQYYAHITPSKKLKEGWVLYFSTVDKEFQELQEIRNLKQTQLIALNQLSDSIKSTDPKIEQLKLEIESIEDELTPTFNKVASSKNLQSALHWERLGFESLINKDLDQAITAFENSENSYNSFHQVYEIARYLKIRRGEIKTDLFWKEVYQKILSDFSWKMPTEAKNQLEKLV